ncbi:MAG: macro domain-containing protein, partial [Candidatus Limnocylindrales bacterium]
AAIDAATRAAMRAAERLGLETVAFPALGTGVGGFPLAEAADLVVGAVRDEAVACPTVARIIFALRGAAAYAAFEDALRVGPGAPRLDPAAAAVPASRPGGLA